jgi:hypothetical protein
LKIDEIENNRRQSNGRPTNPRDAIRGVDTLTAQTLIAPHLLRNCQISAVFADGQVKLLIPSADKECELPG